MKKISIVRQSIRLTADIFSIFDDLNDDEKFIDEIYNDIGNIRKKVKGKMNG